MATWEPPNGGSCEWYTKAEVFEDLGICFDLDPAHPGLDKLKHIPVKKVFTKEDDGLSQSWEGRVWLNPPLRFRDVEMGSKTRRTRQRHLSDLHQNRCKGFP